MKKQRPLPPEVQDLARARLIAAAPDLLEALKEWLTHEQTCMLLGVDGACGECVQCVSMAAVAKAEAESPQQHGN